jgi:hypothetical protein
MRLSGTEKVRPPHNPRMTTWMVIAVVVAVVVVAAGLRVLLRGKEDRLASKELRRLRRQERNPDLHGAAEHRRNMTMEQAPGKRTHPHGP